MEIKVIFDREKKTVAADGRMSDLDGSGKLYDRRWELLNAVNDYYAEMLISPYVLDSFDVNTAILSNERMIAWFVEAIAIADKESLDALTSEYDKATASVVRDIIDSYCDGKYCYHGKELGNRAAENRRSAVPAPVMPKPKSKNENEDEDEDESEDIDIDAVMYAYNCALRNAYNDVNFVVADKLRITPEEKRMERVPSSYRFVRVAHAESIEDCWYIHYDALDGCYVKRHIANLVRDGDSARVVRRTDVPPCVYRDFPCGPDWLCAEMSWHGGKDYWV